MSKTTKHILLFILVWLLLNLLTAASIELSADEAYYWLYGHKMAWGYFDHPPLIGLFNSFIDRYIYHSEISVRILSVLCTGGYFWYLYKIVKPKSTLIFILLCTSSLAIHIFSFTSLPDTPLLFFSIVFFYYFIQYKDTESRKSIWMLCLVIPLLFYTKYHVVLLLFFSILSAPQILRRKSFYLIFIVSIILYIPHIHWQLSNDLPSIKYHFLERNASQFRWKYLFDYLFGQFSFYNPFLIILAIISISKFYFKTNTTDRVFKFNLIGFFIFFLFSSYKSYVEVNWTLPALSALIYFGYRFFEQRPVFGKKIIVGTSLLSLSIIILFRIHLVYPLIKAGIQDRTNDFRGHKKLVTIIESHTKDKAPLATVRYQEAALLTYYSGKFVPSINREGRKNQFNVWDKFSEIHGQPYFLLSDDLDTLKIQASVGKRYSLGYYDHLSAYAGVNIKSVQLTPDSTIINFDPEWYKMMREREHFAETSIRVTLFKDTKEIDQQYVLLKELIDKKSDSYLLINKKRLQKETYRIEISLYSANFGAWSEKWNKKVTVE